MEKKDKDKGYVSYDVAVLLKEKGYDEPCDSFFEDTEEGYTCWACVHKPKKDVNENEYLQPTLWNAQKWLREKHLLHIFVGMANDYAKDADGNVVDSWDFWCYDICYTTNFSHHLVDCEGEFESYEEALNDGIKRALEYI